jgi:hypothetical protein
MEKLSATYIHELEYFPYTFSISHAEVTTTTITSNKLVTSCGTSGNISQMQQ